MKLIKKIYNYVNDYPFYIPFQGNMELKVERGTKIKKGDVLFELESRKVLESYHVQKELGVKPSEALEYISRIDGEYVTSGEVIAERVTNIGLAVKKIYATVDGVVSFDRLNLGYIDILSENNNETVVSALSGTVVDISYGNGLTIASDAYSMKLALFNKGVQSFGNFVVIGDGDSVYTPRDITTDVKGKIVFIGRYVYESTVNWLLEKEASAVVVWSCSYALKKKFAETLFVLGGAGQLAFPDTYRQVISKMNGSYAVISKGRIFWSSIGQLSTSTISGKIQDTIKVNDMVSIVDSDNFGRIGKVVDTTDSGEYIVQLDSKERLLLPDKVLEILK